MPPAPTRITFRPMNDGDLPLFHEWLRRAHVVEWWGDEDGQLGAEAFRERYAPRLMQADNVQPFIALADGAPLGYIQSYVAMGSGDGWWENVTDPGVRGIDQFLADGTRLGQGIGTRMVTAFVRQLFQDTTVMQVQTDPDPANARAIACYEKSGFRRVGEITTPDGAALLMTLDRP